MTQVWGKILVLPGLKFTIDPERPTWSFIFDTSQN